ncbi:MAG: phage major capsid protein [Actinomycetota bacterium]|nr:phage major capsid protein [Actinomycetota bacterium]
MIETLRRAYDKRANSWDKLKVLLEVDDPSAEQRAEMDQLEAAIDEGTRDIERIERGLALQRNLEAVKEIVPNGASRQTREVVEDPEHRYEKAFGKYLRRGMLGLDEAERELLASGRVAADDLRALGTTPDAAGGYLVPPQFETRLVEAMKAFGGMLETAEVITTANGGDIEWPTADDTANKGAILAENTAVTELDVTFGTATLSAYMYVSRLVRVAFQLSNDSAFDIDAYLERTLSERLGRILNEHFTTGTGTSQPQGIVTGGTVGVTGAVSATATITYDNLVDLIFSVNQAYRQTARWMFSDGFLKLVYKLKDANGTPIWQPGMQQGVPSSLLGYPYTINPDVADPAPSAKSALFGDLRQGYIIRRVAGIGYLVLRERYAEFLQNGHLAFTRAGGRADQTAAYRVFQHGAAV